MFRSTSGRSASARREAIISENARKLANMKTEMTESLEELQGFYEQFNEKVITNRHELEAHDRRSNDLKLEIEALQERRERDVRLHGE